MSFKAASREIGGVTVIDLDGRITLGEGSMLLRDLIREKLNGGHKKIVMNMAGINYIDSTGLGELVSAYRLVKKPGRGTEAPEPQQESQRSSANHQAIRRFRHS